MVADETRHVASGKGQGSRYRDVRHAVGVMVRRTVSQQTWKKVQKFRSWTRTVLAHVPLPRYPGMPLLSVVMAAHNTQDYIGEALESLLHQQWPNIEIIIVDDGSTDGTVDAITRFTGKRVRLVRTESRGPGAARNTGARLATGKYIAFFDSDDIADPFFYRQAILSLERTHSDFAVGSYRILIHGQSRLPPSYIRKAQHRTRRHVTLADVPYMTTNALMCTRVYKREFYEKHLAPQPEGVFFEDQLLTMKAFVLSHGFDILHQPALQWRRRSSGDAITQQAAEAENLRQRIGAYKDVADYLASNGKLDVRSERLVQILATDQLTLTQLVVASQEYFDLAREFITWAMGEVGQKKYAERVEVLDRVLHSLVVNTDLETVKSYLLAGGRKTANWVFQNQNGHLVGEFPKWELDALIDIPTSVRTVSAWQQKSIPDNVILKGSHSQTASRYLYWTERPPIRPQIYLQCLDGDHATDTQLALALELGRRGLDSSVVWGISAPDKYVPSGQSSVLIGTEDYYEALATSAVLCFNHEVPEFLVNRPGQTVIQTYHGHPFKAMGIPLWRYREQQRSQMALQLEWRQRWDVLISPSPLATKLYQECFPVRAEIWELGAPRNDILASPPAGLREKVREQFGIDADQTAILYAPTFRDYATNDPWVAPVVATVDPAWLARRLGTSYVILMREHPSNKRAGWKARSEPGVIDVTDHPEINDLILASDIGLFDYSSIRFDYTVTGKPMVYYIPDKEKYFADNPPLWPYEDSIAGPCVTRRDQLVSAIVRALTTSSASSPQYDALHTRVAPYDDGNAASHMADRICDLLPSL